MKKQSNKKGTTALLLVATLILVLLISGIPSAHKADKKNCTAITGVVKEIKAGPPGMIIHLKQDPRIYYISRKTNTHLSLKTLEKELTGKSIQLYITHDWSPLDPFSTMKQVQRLQIGDTVIFTEF
jgi:hypothetical protein